MKKVVVLIVGVDFHGNRFTRREVFFTDNERWIAFTFQPHKAYKRLFRPMGPGYYLKRGVLRIYVDGTPVMKLRGVTDDVLKQQYISIMEQGDPDVQKCIMKQVIGAFAHAAERQVREAQMRALQEKMGMPFEIPQEMIS